MYYSDKPINNREEDKLDRVSFAKQLARAIVSLNVEESFCIGLFGEWGCGKTSVLNMAIQEINELADNTDYEHRPVVVQFNPWNFTENNQLLNQFFSAISRQLRTDERNRKLVSVGDAIEQYSAALAYTEYIPLIGKYLKLIPTLTKTVGTKMKDSAEREMSDATRQKTTVAEALKAQKHKIIVVIDDIDRLSNDQIRQIFQLVNTVACFPNIIYVLSFDKDIVVRALEKVQDCDGNKYLEKIIQVPFQLPVLGKERLWTIFIERINKVMEGKEFSQIGQEYWAEIFWNCVAPFINDLRDVNRIINALQLKSGLLGEEVNYADLVAITSIEIMLPNTYKWIINSKTKLVGGRPYDELSKDKQQEREKHYIERFRGFGAERPKDIVNAIALLFPKFANTVGYSIKQDDEEELICDLRIASSRLFDLYFSLTTDGVSISRGTLNETIYGLSEEELKKYLNMLGENSLGMDYLMELKSNIRKVPYERIEIMVRALLETALNLNGNRGNNDNILPSLEYAEECVFRLLIRVKTTKERYALLYGCITYGSVNCIQAFATVLFRISNAYGRFGNSKIDDDDRIISEDNLIALEKKFLARLNEAGTTCNILDMKNCRLIIKMWSSYDDESLKTYLKENLIDKMNILKFIVLFCDVSGKGECVIYNYNDSFTRYIKKEIVDNIVSEAVNSGVLSGFDDEFRKRIAAYIEWSNAFTAISNS